MIVKSNWFKLRMSSFRRKIQHLALRPIRVFLFHQVGEKYDASMCNPCDWTQIDIFRGRLIELKRRYTFISLREAIGHCKHDVLRFKKYAVLTSDDGSASLKAILPWLKQQKIPITIFVNGKYLDGVSYRERPTERYLNKEELFSLDYEGIEIGHHGWEHNDLTRMDWAQFVDSVEQNMTALRSHPRYVPFWAYTWGKHSREHDKYLIDKGIVPVLIDGMKNYSDKIIHRELIDG